MAASAAVAAFPRALSKQQFGSWDRGECRVSWSKYVFPFPDTHLSHFSFDDDAAPQKTKTELGGDSLDGPHPSHSARISTGEFHVSHG